MWGSLEYLYWGFGHLNGEAPVLGSVTLAQCLNALNYLDRGIFLLAFLLAGGASALWLRKGAGVGMRLPVMLCFLLCGYYGVHLLIEVQPRYRYFLMPVVFLLAGAGTQALWDWWKSRREAGEIPGKSKGESGNPS